jgi:rare lipoprotein A
MNTLGSLLGLAALAATANAMSATKPARTQIDTTDPQVLQRVQQLAALPPLLPPHGHRLILDHSGRKQVGKASVYSFRLQGRHMASGRRLDQRGNAAASKTLPIGTTAKITNLETGRTALVQIQDHGPFVDGRTIDVTRATARLLGIPKREGVASVIVAPVAVPQPDGSLKPGAGAIPGPATAH